jgi:hypothetical protein
MLTFTENGRLGRDFMEVRVRPKLMLSTSPTSIRRCTMLGNNKKRQRGHNTLGIVKSSGLIICSFCMPNRLMSLLILLLAEAQPLTFARNGCGATGSVIELPKRESHEARGGNPRREGPPPWAVSPLCVFRLESALPQAPSFQPRLAQSGEMALQYYRIFNGHSLSVNFQREIGIQPQDFGGLSPCLGGLA